MAKCSLVRDVKAVTTIPQLSYTHHTAFYGSFTYTFAGGQEDALHVAALHRLPYCIKHKPCNLSSGDSFTLVT